MAGDHPDIPFWQARSYYPGRPDGPPLWIVWHTMEAEELPGTAENTARYFQTLSDGRTVSSHYCVDSDSAVQCVLLRHTAYTAGNRPGNYRGINIELAGRAAQTAAQWADAYSSAMLRRACVIAARDMRTYRIPNRWCTVADLQARRPGHTTHNDLRLAFGVTTHTDPGPNFPRNLVLALCAGEDPDVDLTDRIPETKGLDPTNAPDGYTVGQVLAQLVGSLAFGRRTLGPSQTASGWPILHRERQLAEISDQLTRLADQPVTLTDAQVDTIAERLVAAVDNPLGEQDKPAIISAVKQALAEGVA